MEFPRGRRFDGMSVAVTADDMVVFFIERWTYHSISHDAFQIWEAADGSVSELELAERVYGDGSELSLFRLERALDQLEQEGLLEEPAVPRVRRFDRRAVTRLVAAAALGGIVLPAVTSIPAPDSVSAVSPTAPPKVIFDGQKCYGDYRTGACVEGACCCYDPTVMLDGWCRADGGCGYTCV